MALGNRQRRCRSLESKHLLLQAAHCTGPGKGGTGAAGHPIPSLWHHWHRGGANTFCRHWKGCAEQWQLWRCECKCEKLFLSALALKSVILIIACYFKPCLACDFSRDLLGRLCSTHTVWHGSLKEAAQGKSSRVVWRASVHLGTCLWSARRTWCRAECTSYVSINLLLPQ